MFLGYKKKKYLWISTFVEKQYRNDRNDEIPTYIYLYISSFCGVNFTPLFRFIFIHTIMFRCTHSYNLIKYRLSLLDMLVNYSTLIYFT